MQGAALDNDRLALIPDVPTEQTPLRLRALHYWTQQQDLVELLRTGCLDVLGRVDSDKEDEYSLAHVNVNTLLQVSPRTRPIALAADTQRYSASAEEAYNKAGFFVEQKRYKESLAAYNRALELNPYFTAALHNKGNVLSELGQYDEAIAHYDRALALQPDSDAAWFDRGNLLFSIQRYQEAFDSYNEVLRLRPDRTDAELNRERVLIRMNDTERHSKGSSEGEGPSS